MYTTQENRWATCLSTETGFLMLVLAFWINGYKLWQRKSNVALLTLKFSFQSCMWTKLTQNNIFPPQWRSDKHPQTLLEFCSKRKVSATCNNTLSSMKVVFYFAVQHRLACKGGSVHNRLIFVKETRDRHHTWWHVCWHFEILIMVFKIDVYLPIVVCLLWLFLCHVNSYIWFD